MSAGRCPGCGEENQSCRVVRDHMNGCADVISMFQDPERRSLVIDPEDEYRRYHEWLKSPDGQEFVQASRDERDKAYRERFEAKIARERERFGAHPLGERVESHPT